ncbi:MAG: hypothetical protein C0408_01380 [Odoribacter sp.]|nr:hypothetical protein [Odoribacter sp.]
MQAQIRKILSKHWKISSREINRKMILLRKAGNFFREYYSVIKNKPYIKINIVFAGIILLIIAYSGIFSPAKNNYPVTCIHQELTGLSCFSCGLSHSFSLIVRGKVGEAYQWNIYGMRIFLFFVSQLLMRVFFSVRYLKNEKTRNWLIYYDIAGSILIFTIAFYPFFRQLVISLF